ncbi:hypothetical protein OSB04_022462 [Centaurea solstitialis]|uniref:Uncharacterized protein n=1 Tax=Centaurea solstitialis TaxID=347529 RepID=A0AA38WHA5_9ASTR|nr:hypothetical protein OSB04_022462 [Centaurea solstitialis]
MILHLFTNIITTNWAKGQRDTDSPADAHLKPVGTFLPQALRSKLRETGTLRLIPKTLALIAVHRQTAASMSVRPWMRVQHGLTGGEPTSSPTNPLRRLAHTPSFKVSLGQVALLGFRFGFGFGVGLPQVPHPLTIAKKRRLSARKRPSEALLFETILKKKHLRSFYD